MCSGAEFRPDSGSAGRLSRCRDLEITPQDGAWSRRRPPRDTGGGRIREGSFSTRVAPYLGRGGRERCALKAEFRSDSGSSGRLSRCRDLEITPQDGSLEPSLNPERHGGGGIREASFSTRVAPYLSTLSI